MGGLAGCCFGAATYASWVLRGSEPTNSRALAVGCRMLLHFCAAAVVVAALSTLAPLTAGPPPLPVYHYDNCQLANGTTCGKCGFGCDHCGPPPPGARVTLDASRFHINGGSCQINDPDGPFYDAKHGVYHVFVRPPNAAPCDRLLLLAAAGCCCCCCWLLLAAGCWLLAAGCWLLAAAAMQSHD